MRPGESLAGDDAARWPAPLRWPAVALVLAWARWRRRQGRYDRRTLTLFWWAWRQAGDPASLLALAMFRRDLGRPLPRRWLERLQSSQARWRPSQSRDLAVLCQDLAPPEPALAAQRQDFARWLASRAGAGGVCVAGNAAALAGAGLGPHIDAQAAVVRFNAWRVASVSVADIGLACAVWVVSPGFRGAPTPGADWIIVSGPDPHARLAGWTWLTGGQARRGVLTVPLPVWRALVRQLQAPPSAGLLLLAWLRQLQGGWHGLTAVGIGTGLDARGRRHLWQSNRQTGQRHDWPREARLVARWREQGLTCGLGDNPGP